MSKILALLVLISGMFIVGCGGEEQQPVDNTQSSTEFSETDNQFFDSMNSSHKAMVLSSIRPEFVAQNPDVLSMTTSFREYDGYIVIDIVWDDETYIRQSADAEDEEVFVPAGTWTRTVSNDALMQIVGG